MLRKIHKTLKYNMMYGMWRILSVLVFVCMLPLMVILIISGICGVVLSIIGVILYAVGELGLRSMHTPLYWLQSKLKKTREKIHGDNNA